MLDGDCRGIGVSDSGRVLIRVTRTSPGHYWCAPGTTSIVRRGLYKSDEELKTHFVVIKEGANCRLRSPPESHRRVRTRHLGRVPQSTLRQYQSTGYYWHLIKFAASIMEFQLKACLVPYLGKQFDRVALKAI